MSDQKLRDLERRWKETGSPDDEAAYLLERVRVGDLSRERLELAAYCGHEGARGAIGATTAAPVLLTEWVLGAAGPGQPVSVRLGLIVSKLALDSTQALHSERELRVCRALFGAVTAWADCPCAIHKLGVMKLASAAQGLLSRPAPIEQAGDWAITVLLLVSHSISDHGVISREAMTSLSSIAGRELSERRVLATLQSELCQWALTAF